MPFALLPSSVQPPSTALAVFVTRAYATRLFRWLKYVWYMVTLMLSGEFWSITLLPPSPKSARNHVAAGWYQWVPLSCVPPIVKFGSSGWIAMLWNWVALRPAVLRLDHVAPASDERQMPPSLPSYTMLELDGANTIACASAWSPTTATPTPLNVAPPS